MNKDQVFLSSPHFESQELNNISKAINLNNISSGDFLIEFENQLKDYCKVNEVALTNSGTSAIHIALKLLGIKKDDIVLCQSLTFVGTCNPILYEKAIPVFIDSEETTWNICPTALEKAIKKLINLGKRPKAIIVVHLYGMPALMNDLIYLAQKYAIPIIEDAAEALGSFYDNKPCGSLGEFSILSFNANKIITTSGGGAILSNNSNLIKLAKSLSSHAKENKSYYHHKRLGYNYRLSNLSAAIGVAQMNSLSEKIAARRLNFSYYKKRLMYLHGIDFQDEPLNCKSNRWLTCILIKDKHTDSIKNDLQNFLIKNKIECRPIWKPMHTQPLYKDFEFFGGKVSERLFQNGLCLPSGSNLRLSEIKSVVDLIINKIGEY